MRTPSDSDTSASVTPKPSALIMPTKAAASTSSSSSCPTDSEPGTPTIDHAPALDTRGDDSDSLPSPTKRQRHATDRHNMSRRRRRSKVKVTAKVKAEASDETFAMYAPAAPVAVPSIPVVPAMIPTQAAADQTATLMINTASSATNTSIHAHVAAAFLEANSSGLTPSFHRMGFDLSPESYPTTPTPNRTPRSLPTTAQAQPHAQAYQHVPAYPSYAGHLYPRYHASQPNLAPVFVNNNQQQQFYYPQQQPQSELYQYYSHTPHFVYPGAVPSPAVHASQAVHLAGPRSHYPPRHGVVHSVHSVHGTPHLVAQPNTHDHYAFAAVTPQPSAPTMASGVGPFVPSMATAYTDMGPSFVPPPSPSPFAFEHPGSTRPVTAVVPVQVGTDTKPAAVDAGAITQAPAPQIDALATSSTGVCLAAAAQPDSGVSVSASSFGGIDLTLDHALNALNATLHAPLPESQTEEVFASMDLMHDLPDNYSSVVEMTAEQYNGFFNETVDPHAGMSAWATSAAAPGGGAGGCSGLMINTSDPVSPYESEATPSPLDPRFAHLTGSSPDAVSPVTPLPTTPTKSNKRPLRKKTSGASVSIKAKAKNTPVKVKTRRVPTSSEDSDDYGDDDDTPDLSDLDSDESDKYGTAATYTNAAEMATFFSSTHGEHKDRFNPTRQERTFLESVAKTVP